MWTIRKCSEHDAALVQALTDLFHESSTDQVWLHSWLQNPSHHLWIAEEAGTTLGFVSAYTIDRIEFGRPEFFLYEIEVLAEHRQRGIGKALIYAARDYATAQNMLNMFVLTNHDNPTAIALYRSTGAFTYNEDEIMFEYKTTTIDDTD